MAREDSSEKEGEGMEVEERESGNQDVGKKSGKGKEVVNQVKG